MNNDTITQTDTINDVQSSENDVVQCECPADIVKWFNRGIQEVNNKVNTVETNTNADIDALHELICSIRQNTSTQISELTTNSVDHEQQLAEQENKIKYLEDASQQYNEQLKQTWVRVMSTKEYNKLVMPPDNVPYNSRYRYPNTLYFIVDYNKPKAVYIGDILIAKAKDSGSNGFAYSFPIVF